MAHDGTRHGRYIKSSKEKVDAVKDTREFIWVDQYGNPVKDGPGQRFTFRTKKYIDPNEIDDGANGANGAGINAHEKTLDAGKTHENILHNFATYNTLFTLSGLSEDELQNQTYFSNAPHEIIARSGGIGNANVDNEAYKSEVNKLRQRNKASHLTGETRAKGTD